MQTTILKPIGQNRASKTYALVKGKPTVTNAYSNPKHFNYAVVNFKDLQGLYDLLDRCKSSNVFRISGLPKKGLPQRTRRLKDNFVTDKTRLIYFDADSWVLPKGYDTRNEENIYKAVKHILCDKIGLDCLRDAACVVLLSSSSWSYKKLRAHIYFMLDEEIDIEELHSWGKAYNSMDTEYKLDYSVFRRVQPDYISKRICDGFQDPLPDSLRLTIHCDRLQQCVSLDALKEHIDSDNNMADAFANIPTTGVVETRKEKGATWEETLSLCGTAQHGINDVSYRGCAQLVQSVGNKTIKSNLNFYVEKVFSLVWTAIKTHGIRDTKKERDYYDKARFRNYIQTALSKNFGNDTDVINSSITKAIKNVLAGSNPSILFDADMLDKYRILRAKNPGKWATFRTVVKNKLKGKVTMSDIDRAMSSTSEANAGEQIEQIVNSFNWIEGEIDKGLYCKKGRPNGYHLIGLDSGLSNDLYLRALEMFDGKVPSQFEQNVMKFIFAKSRDEATSLFSQARVETRCYTPVEDDKNVLYFNMGSDSQGNMTTCVVKEDSVDLVPSTSCPIIWSTDKQILPCGIAEPPSNLNFRRIRSMYAKKFIKNMNRFINVEDSESMVDTIAWMVAASLNIGTAPILEVTGPSESGKSTAALFVKELIDPTSADIKEGPDLHNGIYKKEDLAKVLRARHITIFDNLSNLKPYTQDLLCSIATGWKYDLRIMYSQQFVSLNIKKPIILTSLSPIITNQDLRSRSVSVGITARRGRHKGDIYAVWEELKEETRLGLFMFISKVLQRVNAMRAAGTFLNDRNLWINAAKTEVMLAAKYKGGNIAAIQSKIAQAKRDRDVSEALLSEPSAGVLAWMYEDTDTFHGNRVMLTTTELYERYKDYTYSHSGDMIDVLNTKVAISSDKMPNSARGFGMLIAKIRNDILAVTGWSLSKARGTDGSRQNMFEKGGGDET